LSLTFVFVLVYCCCLLLFLRLTHPVVPITGPMACKKPANDSTFPSRIIRLNLCPLSSSNSARSTSTSSTSSFAATSCQAGEFWTPAAARPQSRLSPPRRLRGLRLRSESQAIAQTRALVTALAAHLPAENFRVEPIESICYPDNTFDLVICSAVLHFARDDAHFNAMLENLWRVLKPGGLLFCRLASTIGMPHQHLNGHRYLAPDGVERYSVDEPSSCTSPKD
jgi:hypothetical protein